MGCQRLGKERGQGDQGVFDSIHRLLQSEGGSKPHFRKPDLAVFVYRELGGGSGAEKLLVDHLSL